MLLSQFVRESADVVAPRYLITLLDVVEREQSIVAVAHVVGAEVDAGAVACRADHQLQHHFWDVELLSSW